MKTLGRIHTWEQFLHNYELVRELGFANVNIDLMSALPGQTREGWLSTPGKSDESESGTYFRLQPDC